MIKANELRIGNYVGIGGDAVLVTGLKPHDFACTINDHDGFEIIFTEKTPVQNDWVNDNDQFYGIEITKKWLLGFCFQVPRKKNDDLICYEKGNFRVIEDNGEFLITNCKSLPNCPYIPLLYVHQLQNLYFALTGEELTLKT